MSPYWLDSGALIQAERETYPRAMWPAFWVFVEKKLQTGEIRMSERAWKELAKGDDPLAKWCRARRSTHLRKFAEKDAQAAYAEIASYVAEKFYDSPWHLTDFCRGADGWIIAQAMTEGGSVVTQELSHPSGLPFKIPTLCDHFNVRCINVLTMLKELKFKG